MVVASPPILELNLLLDPFEEFRPNIVGDEMIAAQGHYPGTSIA